MSDRLEAAASRAVDALKAAEVLILRQHAQVEMLVSALRASSNYDLDDGPCWCMAPGFGDRHDAGCKEAKAALKEVAQ